MPTDWIEHRRSGDREAIGWMRPEGGGFVVIDRLGRERTEAVDWFTAEETLDDLGIDYLADKYELRLENGEWLQVRIVEVLPEEIRVKKDDWGDMTAPQIYYSVAFPIPDRLRPKA
ncbi:MAG: hypothetical protein ABI238_07365 [Terrimesophilobacter sp.]